MISRERDLEDAGTFCVDLVIDDVSVEDYDALLLPGGMTNPDKLRTHAAAVDFVRDSCNRALSCRRDRCNPIARCVGLPGRRPLLSVGVALRPVASGQARRLVPRVANAVDLENRS